jgi:hypothetical protein
MHVREFDDPYTFLLSSHPQLLFQHIHVCMQMAESIMDRYSIHPMSAFHYTLICVGESEQHATRHMASRRRHITKMCNPQPRPRCAFPRA